MLRPGSVLLLIVMAIGCCPPGDVIPTLNDADKNFALQSSADNLGIMALSSLAIDKSSSPAVTDLAHDMHTVHEAVSETLRIIAMDLGLVLETSMNTACASLHDQLQTHPGLDFDSIYVHRLQEIQNNRSLLFLTHLENGLNQRLKDYTHLHAMHANQHAAKIDSMVQAYH